MSDLRLFPVMNSPISGPLHPKSQESAIHACVKILSEQRAEPVATDPSGEYIEIDFPKMEIGKFYLVEYGGERYATKRLSEHEIEFYDVV